MKNLWLVMTIAAFGIQAGSNAGELLIKNGEKIAFLGDSITQFGNRPDGYVGLVMDGLKRSKVNAVCIPAGVSGNKSNDMLLRLDKVLAKRPNWLLLNCGVNDVGHGTRGVELPDFKKNISAILDRTAASNVKVMILTPPIHGEKLDSAFNVKLESYCAFLRAEAAKRELPLVDLNICMRRALAARAQIRGNKLTIDNLHMNGYGNQVLAAEILSVMGIPEKNLEQYRLKWNKIPSMAPILNTWYNPQYKISINDYERLYAESERCGITVNELVKKVLNSYIDSLKKAH